MKEKGTVPDMNGAAQKPDKSAAALSIISSVFVLFNGAFVLLLNSRGRFGHYAIYAQCVVIAVLLVLVPTYIITLICSYRKLAKKGAYIAGAAVMAAMCVLYCISSDAYIKDISGGTKTITTYYYFEGGAGSLNLYADKDGQAHVYMTAEQAEFVKAAAKGLAEEKWLELGDAVKMNGHKNSLTVEYYPNTNVVRSITSAEYKE